MAGSQTTIADGAVLTLVGGSVASSATISGAGSLVVEDGVIYGSHTLPPLTIAPAATLELGPGALVTTPSFSGVPGGLEVDADSDGAFGQIETPAAVDLSYIGLDINAVGYTPACGTTVDAVNAGSVTHGFIGVDGTAPPNVTWVRESTATSAGATLDCS